MAVSDISSLIRGSLIAMAFSLTLSWCSLHAQCTRPADALKSSVAIYAATRFHVDPTTVRVVSVSQATTSCFWEYQLATDSDRVLKLYLSSDFRYLTPALYDLTKDPLEDESLDRQKLVSTLLQGRNDFNKDNKKQKILLVEFADFQCPFCSALNSSLTELQQRGKLINVRIVFRNFPLPRHEWSTEAALIGECLRRENATLFQKYESFIYQNQALIDATNLLNKSVDFITQEGTYRRDVSVCMSDPQTSAAIKQDMDIGRKVGVRATPTFFIDGVKYDGTRSTQELEQILMKAGSVSVP